MDNLLVTNIDRNVTKKDYTADEMRVIKTFHTVQGEAPFAGYPCLFLRLAGCNRGAKVGHDCEWCFPGNYKVRTPYSTPISLDSIKIGDKLTTFDENFQLVETTVINKIQRDYPLEKMIGLRFKTISNRLIWSTEDHPYHVVNKGFVKAKDLKPGMILSHATNSQLHSFNKVMKNPLHNKESVKKMAMSKSYPKSNLEKKTHRILRKLGHNFQYTGNTSFPIGDEKRGYLFPDFVDHETNKVIEVYDTTFKMYSTDRHTKKGRKDYENKRRKHYARYGYSTLFLTQTDLHLKTRPGSGNPAKKDTQAIRALKKKINQFMVNGEIITEVIVGGNSSVSRMSPGKSSDTVSVINLTCHPYNTFMLEKRNLHVHNCDTYFSYDIGIIDSPENWADKVYKELKPYHEPMLVITGGEPLLQTPALSSFLLRLHYHARKNNNPILVQFETNGDFTPIPLIYNMLDNDCHLYLKLHFVTSPKGNPMRRMWFDKLKESILSEVCISAGFTFRRVVATYAPYDDINPEWLDNPLFDNVFLSPMMVYKMVNGKQVVEYEQSTANSNHCFYLMKKYDYKPKMSFQSHVFLSIE